MQSIWKQEVQFKSREKLTQDIETEVAVLGAGITGILIGYFLKQAGHEVVLLEANRVCGGQTGNTTAKITAQHGLCYSGLVKACGEDAARAFYRANQNAVEAFQQIVNREGIACAFERQSSILYAAKDASPLHTELRACKTLGMPVQFHPTCELPISVTGALELQEQAQFHPLQFLKPLAESLQIYEHTPAVSVKGNTVTLQNGCKVKAYYIVFATHFPFINVPGLFFARMHQSRSYALALKHAKLPAGMYYGIDGEGISLRTSGDLVLLGGYGHRTGENSAGGNYHSLEKAAQKYFKGSEVVAEWSAQDCMPSDGLPFVGRYASSRPNWFVATGFRKWGMTSAMLSAQLICDLIEKKHNPVADLLSPQRVRITDSAGFFAENISKSVKGLTRYYLEPKKKTIADLPFGHGGVVETDGKKRGVYKDENGEIFTVDPRCPHMGCALAWNPEERTWDCPCHGSRFDYKGNLIGNPAEENLPAY